MPPERSNWIGLVCWGLIIDGTYSIYTTMKVLGTVAFKQTMTGLPWPASIAYAVLFGSCLVMIVSGICMYERQGWARYVYLVGVLPLMAQRWIQHHLAQQELLLNPPRVPHHDWQKYLLILQVALYLISAWIIFTRGANRYYHPPMYVDE